MVWEDRLANRIIKQLAHACIFAHDLAATEAFYRDVLGIEVKFRFMREGKLIGYYLDAGNRTFIEVFEKQSASFDESNVINHLCLEVENMDEAIAQIRSRGVSITDKKFGIDDTWQSWTADPNGVKIELFEYTAKSAQFLGGDREVNW